jgi:fructosamine-3-kinase
LSVNVNANVQEQLLREKIDPWLTEATLSALATEALGERACCGAPAVLTGGCWNRVVAAPVDDGSVSLVFKIAPRLDDADLQREFAVMRFLHTRTSLPVPEVYRVDVTGKWLPGSVLVMQKLPGAALEGQTLNAGDQERVATEIAEYVADLNAHTDAGFGGLELPSSRRTSDWPAFWLPRFDQALAEAQQKRPDMAGLFAAIGNVRASFPRLLNIGPQGTLTHYDIWGGNVLVDTTGERMRVSGFLDAIGYYADYAREISSMFGLGGRRFMDVYAQRHGLDPTFQLRHDIYALKMCLQLACMYPDAPRPVAQAREFLSHVRASLESGA